MTKEQWQKIQDLLPPVAALAAPQRLEYLQQAGADAVVCAELERMLDAEPELGDFLEQPLLIRPEEESLVGAFLGDYRIEREIGRGGMGVVYLAAHADAVFEKNVAIKLVFPALETAEMIGRFEQERRILARLDHPGIARILDGGTTPQGWPYVVMEYVNGVPMDMWCEQQQLSLDARLRLFQDVCAVVAYAHQNLIVHRDLKPSNIFVTTDGQVRLLDFGLARLLDAPANARLTRSALHFLTPEYASPEQLRGESVATPSDVYSLGVLLFQLLTGKRPYDLEPLTLAQTLQVVNETDPPKPSARVNDQKLRRELQGDLDNITLKALRHDPRERYPSVAEFCADVQRYLDGEPVRAQPASFVYRTRKYIRRHKAASAVVALLALTLIAGTITSLWRARVAEAEARQARRLLYHAQIRQAGYDLTDGKFAQVRATLESFIPRAGEEDLRSFEWFYLWRQTHRAQLEIPHQGTVNAVAYAPDGKTFVTASQDGTTRLWDAATGQALKAWREPKAQALAVAFAPDGQRLAVAYSSSQIRVIHLSTDRMQSCPPSRLVQPQALAFASDGKRLLAATTQGPMLLAFTDKGCAELLPPRHHLVLPVAFFPAGNTFVTADREGQVQFWDTATGQVKATLRAHQGWVFDVAISPDGRWLATSGGDFLVKLWDAQTRRAVRVFTGHTNAVRSVRFSPDGTMLVTGSADRTIRLWDIQTGAERNRFAGHTDRVRTVAFAPDGKHVISASDDGTARIWNLDEPETAEVLTGHTKRVFKVALAPDGKTLATAGSDEIVQLWDMPTRRLQHTLKERKGEIYGLAFAEEGQTLAIASLHPKLRLWQPGKAAPPVSISAVHCEATAFLPDGRAVAFLRQEDSVEMQELTTGHRLLTIPVAATWVRFSTQSNEVVTGGADGIVRLWEAAKGRLRRAFRSPLQERDWPFLTPDGRLLQTDPRTREIKEHDLQTGRERRLWQYKDIARIHLIAPDYRAAAVHDTAGGITLRDLPSGRVLSQLQSPLAEAVSSCFSPDQRWLVAGYRDGTIRVWETASGQEQATWRGGETRIGLLVFSPDGNLLVSADAGPQIKLWDLRTQKEYRTLQGHQNAIASVTWSPDAQQLISSGIDGKIIVWDVGTGKPLTTQQHLSALGESVQTVAASPDGRYLALAIVEGVIALLDARTRHLLHLLSGHQPAVWSLCFAPDGNTLASASWDGTVRLWDVPSGRELLTFRNHNAPVTAVAFSPDGRLIASGGDDHNVRIWEATTGREVAVCEGQADVIRAVAFTPDGRRVASAGVEPVIRLCDVATGAELLQLRGHTDEVWSLLFTPDGTSLISGSWDKTARIWRTMPHK
jgi:WD40 repeat protein/tRNA A-37 threonylcarbamoyl transferase component Bud32